MACCTHLTCYSLASTVAKRSETRARRAICAQFCGKHSSRVPQWLLKRLGSGTRHIVASATVTCLRYSSNGRPFCAAQKFTQEQVSSDGPPAQKMGDLSRRARMPARPRTRSVYAMEVICRPRSAPIAQTPINLFNSHRRR